MKKDKSDLQNYRLVNLFSLSGNVMEKILLETRSKHMKGKKVIGRSHLGLMKGISCLTNLRAF